MSRCFPFPPPGYEAKPRSEHGDLLKKEKHKEKKHKKGRKDREKGERKEKDQSHKKDKHNKKKHKREKYKDRRNNKESDKKKRQILEQETRKNDDLGNRRSKEIAHNGEVKDSKPTDELVTQITCQEGHANHTCSSTSKLSPQSIEWSVVVGSKEKERTSLSRVSGKSGQTAQYNHASEKEKDSGHVSKARIHNGKSLQVGSAEKLSTRKHGSNGVGLRHATTLATQQNGRSTPSPNAHTTTLATQQNGRSTPSPNMLQRIEQLSQHSDVSSHSAYGESGSMSTRGVMEKENGSANNFHTRMDPQLVQDKDGKVQLKPQIKHVKANQHKVVKDRDRDHDVNLKGVKDRDDVKRRKARGKKEDKEDKNGVVDKAKQKGLNAHESRKNNTHDLMDFAHLNEKFTSDDVKKRKELEANCSLHEHSMRTTKLPRSSPADLPSLNGRTLNHSQGAEPYSSTVPVGANLCEADRIQDNKECYNNGIAGSYLDKHTASISSSSHDCNDVSLAPPHPDTKYLSQVYSIPSVADCSEYIDQDWLFHGGCVHQETATPKASESPQLWAEARPINSAGIVALPYVVPL